MAQTQDFWNYDGICSDYLHDQEGQNRRPSKQPSADQPKQFTGDAGIGVRQIVEALDPFAP